ncbi:Segregation and condensation protein A [Gammaproteobacteria bacterium]
MNIKNSSDELSQEEIILRAVKTVLTKVIRDTAVAPGTLHPLTAPTRDEIRHCFVLITQREQELALSAGRPATDRPHFKDESPVPKDTVIPISSIKRPRREFDE